MLLQTRECIEITLCQTVMKCYLFLKQIPVFSFYNSSSFPYFQEVFVNVYFILRIRFTEFSNQFQIYQKLYSILYVTKENKYIFLRRNSIQVYETISCNKFSVAILLLYCKKKYKYCNFFLTVFNFLCNCKVCLHT